MVTEVSREDGDVHLGGETVSTFSEDLGRWSFETVEDLSKDQVFQERSLMRLKTTNRRASRSIRAFLKATRRCARLQAL